MSPDRRLQVVHLFNSPVLGRFGRLFDLACALSGLTVLIILGPVMIYQVGTTRIPLSGELIPVEGAVLACNPNIRGALLRIAGYQREFQSPLDSCGKVSPEVPGRAVRVSVYVLSSELNATRSRGAATSFGLTADSEVVHELAADLTAARLDRVVLAVTGIVATAALGWLGFIVVRDPPSAARLFT